MHARQLELRLHLLARLVLMGAPVGVDAAAVPGEEESILSGGAAAREPVARIFVEEHRLEQVLVGVVGQWNAAGRGVELPVESHPLDPRSEAALDERLWVVDRPAAIGSGLRIVSRAVGRPVARQGGDGQRDGVGGGVKIVEIRRPSRARLRDGADLEVVSAGDVAIARQVEDVRPDGRRLRTGSARDSEQHNRRCQNNKSCRPIHGASLGEWITCESHGHLLGL